MSIYRYIPVYTRLYRYIPDSQIITLILPLIMNVSGAAEVGEWGAARGQGSHRISAETCSATASASISGICGRV